MNSKVKAVVSAVNDVDDIVDGALEEAYKVIDQESQANLDAALELEEIENCSEDAWCGWWEPFLMSCVDTIAIYAPPIFAEI